MHSIVTTFRGADIKMEVANFCAAMNTLIDQDGKLFAKIIAGCHITNENYQAWKFEQKLISHT